MKDFTRKVVQIIQEIPSGYVMTYGQIAKEAGNHRGARQVSWILSSMSQNYHLPWHRVINAKGAISYTGSEQRELLEWEGVSFNLQGKVDLETYQYIPSSSFTETE